MNCKKLRMHDLIAARMKGSSCWPNPGLTQNKRIKSWIGSENKHANKVVSALSLWQSNTAMSILEFRIRKYSSEDFFLTKYYIFSFD